MLSSIRLFGGLAAMLFASVLWAEVIGETDWQNAYLAQREALTIKAVPDGFKAGLTSIPAQQKFQSDRAVYGVLPAGSRLDSQALVHLSVFGRGMIELELAFRLKRAVITPIADISSLKLLVADIAPALELPDLGFLAGKKSGVLDVVRGNVAAHSFVVGQAQPLLDLDPNTLDVVLRRDDKVVVSASSGELAGGQWQNLLDLINDSVQRGWIIQPDQWLLTGAIGGMKPLQPGRYEASIAELSKLAIQFEP
jgi:2-keto-4-pentenoate hydratase